MVKDTRGTELIATKRGTARGSSSGSARRNITFGLSITPDNVEKAFTLAKNADESGLDIIEHVYSSEVGLLR
jgi:hypothetical protein